MTLRVALSRPARYVSLAAGVLPALAFPGAGPDWLAWVALLPAMAMMQRAPSGREAAVRGWWFGVGFIAVAMYWLAPTIGPGLVLLALLFGALQAPFGLAVHGLLRPPVTVRGAAAALLVIPSTWVSCEFVRSWHALGGPWALLGASQWRHPAILGLAAFGGVWLVSAAVVAVNTGLLILVSARTPRPRTVAAVGVAAALAGGPALFNLQTVPEPDGAATVALVQPGQTRTEAARFEASARITESLVGTPLDLIVWGESATTADLDRDQPTVARLEQLSAATGAELLAGEDARKADGRISKDAVLINQNGIVGRYRKIRLVPFGEYIPLRPVLGWIAGISRAAGENRAPGSGFHLLSPVDRNGRPLPIGALICFESAFPDMSRAAADQGARLIVYQSATSTFQHTWAPEQHAALGALRAAESGRPVVQAALTGESVAYDRQGRRLARMATGDSGAVTVQLALAAPGARTWYDRLGDWAPLTAVAITAAAGGVALRRRSTAERPTQGTPKESSGALVG